MYYVALELLLAGCIAFVLARAKTSPRPAGLRGRIRDGGWGLVLLPAAVMAAAMSGGVHVLAAIEPAIAVILVFGAPRLAAKLAPYATLGLGIEGLILTRNYHEGFTNQVLYGIVSAGGWESRRDQLVLLEAGVFFAFGLWLLLEVDAPGAGLLRALIARWLDPARGRISPVLGLLLIPVTVLTELLLGPRYWFGMPTSELSAIILLDAAIATASLILVFRSRIWAATVAEAGLLVLGVYGLAIAAFNPVHIGLSRRGAMLRAEVTDDGAGGADSARGTGLAGVERRLATFDGILAVSSPPGGPTIVVIEVPCASSSAKTSSC
jgi:hypothetical protein